MKRYWHILVMLFALVLVTHWKAQSEVNIGRPAPDFSLSDTQGKNYSLSQYKGKFVVLEWFNFDCPFVGKHYNSGNMQNLQKIYRDKDVIWLSINSSAAEKEGFYPADEINRIALEKGMSSTAILLDPQGKVGKLYGAKTTPHMFVINPEGELIYQGAIDDKPSVDPADIALAQNYVQAALDAAMAGESVVVPSTKSYGCSVKY